MLRHAHHVRLFYATGTMSGSILLLLNIEEALMHSANVRIACILSYFLAGTVAISSLGGVSFSGAYARETASWAAQGIGQDVVNIVLVVPLLLVSTLLTQRGKRLFLLIQAGLLVYCAYSYVLYSFCVHFNRLFFFYCAGLGLAVYALILIGTTLSREGLESWFIKEKSTLIPGIYFFVLTMLFYILWLSEDIPATLAGRTPTNLQDVGLVTNPVHVLDLSIVLPAMLIASVALFRKKSCGYLLFPVMMVFSIVMTVGIAGMVVAMKWHGVTGDARMATVCGVVVVFNSLTLCLFLRTLRRS